MLKQIHLLIQELELSQIKFCHWKSNFHLDNALNAEEDLDILVSKKHIDIFIEILQKFKFKQTSSCLNINQPGVYHFFGLDEDSGKLIHIHVFKVIATGDSLIKNYILPIDELIFNNLVKFKGINVPSRPAELIVFCLRNSLKYSTLLDFWLMRKHKNSIIEEYNWLTKDNEVEASKSLIKKYINEITFNDFEKALNHIVRGTIFEQYKIGREYSNKFKTHRRHNKYKYFFINLKTIIRLFINKYYYKRKYMNFSSGGKIVAFIGPPASGKSTLSKLIRQWLSAEFSVAYYHIGKPPGTILTFVPRLFLPIFRQLFPKSRSTYIEMQNEKSNKDISYLHILRKIIVAYDRKSILKKIVRLKEKNHIIFCDRYPSDEVGAVDGRSFSMSLIESQKSRYKKKLMIIENSIYNAIIQPDIIINLNVPKEIALKRDRLRKKKSPKFPDYVNFRHSMSKQPNFNSVGNVININTNNSIDDTLKIIKKSLWLYK